MKKSPIDVSIVVPVYNEEENVPLLHREIVDVMDALGKTYEILFVDDGSSDTTRDVLRQIAHAHKQTKAVLFRRNYGQSAAMGAGFQLSTGDVVVAMDGDLQNDPRDIPKLLNKIAEGYDVVSGWRKNRKDTLILRKIPSRIANRLICSVTDVQLHDTGCSLKAFRREVVDRIRLYGELHRFIPGLARVEGARISEIVVNHRMRQFGQSKYNISRTFRVIMDLSSLNIFLKYLRNPLRFFGKMGGLFITLGTAGIFWLAYQVGVKQAAYTELNVIVTLVFLILVMGFQSIFLGLIGSLIVKTGSRKGRTLPPYILSQEGNENG